MWTWSCSSLYTLPAWASPMGKPRFTSVPGCADGSVISNLGTHRVQELYVTCSPSCGKFSLGQHYTALRPPEHCGFPGIGLIFCKPQVVITLKTCMICGAIIKCTPAKWKRPGNLFLDVIHQVLQIQVVPVMHDGFLHEPSQSIPSLSGRGHRGLYEQSNSFNISISMFWQNVVC